MDGKGLLLTVLMQFLELGKWAGELERKCSLTPPWLRFFSGYHDLWTTVEGFLFFAFLYLAVLALPFLQVVESLWRGARRDWIQIYSTSFTSALPFLLIMWTMLLLVSVLQLGCRILG